MQKNDTQALERYLSRIRALYPLLFNIAHAVTGSSDRAEYCLQCAMLQGWTADEGEAGSHGFRETMKRLVLRAALKQTDGETDWDGLQAEADGDALYSLLAQESRELRRVLALHCGCGLSLGRAARICDLDAQRVRGAYRRFLRRMFRRLPGGNQNTQEKKLHHAVRLALQQSSPLEPDIGGVFRSFQADAAATMRPSRLPVRIFQGALAAVLAVLCIVAFWFAAVLMQQPVLEEAQENMQIEESIS